MEIEWEDSGPTLTDEEIRRFEERNGVNLDEEHKWFLRNVSNGGGPVNNLIVPTTDCPGGAADLLGVYGIGHTRNNFNLEVEINRDIGRAKQLIPFGYDDVGGALFVDMVERPGRIVYNPGDPDRFYHSADSIQAFLENLVQEGKN